MAGSGDTERGLECVLSRSLALMIILSGMGFARGEVFGMDCDPVPVVFQVVFAF